jgi:hypothetical protein
MSALPPDIDPDRLVLTKKDVVNLIGDIIHRWSKNPKSNYKAIAAGYAMKGFVQMTPEETVKQIWTEIINGFNAFLMENAIARARSENPDWATMMEKVRKRVRDD